MKKITLNPVLVYCMIFSFLITFEACKKKEDIPFQGPQNASFEEGPNSNATSWSSIIGNCESNTYAYRLTGTGFLPSAGVYYEHLELDGTTCGGTGEVGSFYQDNIDLTHSTTLTFDYTFNYYIPNPSIRYDVSSTVQMLFTSNGTSTLWEQTIDSTNTLPIQVLNKTISLPATTSPGRLTITLKNFWKCIGIWDAGQQAAFCIDNIRVQ